ncbi:MAG TPA: hypothetical protein ENJ00_11790 [Phycisphaerales bacterium]|nr:hypothetical protein [Phycisphaerales bacterium]
MSRKPVNIPGSRKDTSPPRSARELVGRVLEEQARRFPEIEPIELDTSGLDERDSALAHKLYDASIRRWLTLEFLIQQGLRRPFRELEAGVQAALILGSAQIVLLDRIPVHAAIDEAVEWVKRRVRPGAGGLVNAVLRRVAEGVGDRIDDWQDDLDSIPLADGARRLVGIRLPEDAKERLSVATSVPMPLIERWANDLDREAITTACLHGLVRPPTILHVRHARVPLPEDWLSPHAVEGHAVWTGPRDGLTELLSCRDDVWVQDPSSSSAVLSVADRRPGLVVDLCAGQGTKTRQLRACFPDAEIVATDVDPARYSVLSGVFAGDERVRVKPMDAVRSEARGRADLVLLDVPCSNTGVMGRRVEARYRATPASLKRLRGIQRQIIGDAVGLLGAGGVLLYATCSMDHAENQSQARWANRHLGLGASRERQALPGGMEAVRSVDGSYSVVLSPGGGGGA